MKLKIGLLLAMVCVFSFNAVANAEMTYMKSFFVGQFKLNLANWDADKESQLLNNLSALPEKKSFKVIGHTDDSGSESFNKVLARQRADLVAQKISKLLPENKISVYAEIYKPGDGQNIDYRMVEVQVFAEPMAVANDIEKSIQQIAGDFAILKSASFDGKNDLSGIEQSLLRISRSIENLEKDSISSEQFEKIENLYFDLQKAFKDLQNEQGSKKPLFYVMIFLLLLILVLLVVKKRNPRISDEKEFHYLSVNVKTSQGIKTFSVKYEKLAEEYINPINAYKFRNLPKLKDSIISNLVNYYRDDTDRSPSFVAGNYYEKISQLMKLGIIVETEE